MSFWIGLFQFNKFVDEEGFHWTAELSDDVIEDDVSYIDF